MSLFHDPGADIDVFVATLARSGHSLGFPIESSAYLHQNNLRAVPPFDPSGRNQDSLLMVVSKRNHDPDV